MTGADIITIFGHEGGVADCSMHAYTHRLKLLNPGLKKQHRKSIFLTCRSTGVLKSDLTGDDNLMPKMGLVPQCNDLPHSEIN